VPYITQPENYAHNPR